MKDKPKPFHFKQFTIHQEKSAMKVGTDGVLLGAWSDPANCKQILDVGTGTGLIALMLAQRSKGNFTAIEIDQAAAEEAQQNFKQSPWSDRIQSLHSDFKSFAVKTELKFDLIVSNPPYFQEKSGNDSRSKARQEYSLPFEALLEFGKKILNKSGSMDFILPISFYQSKLEFAESIGLYPIKTVRIKGKPSAAEKRVLVRFQGLKSEPVQSHLCIETEKRHHYSPEYLDLVKDYLLLHS